MLNYHFTRLIQENKPLPEITQNLFYQACSAVSVMKERKEKIDTTDELYISFSHYKRHQKNKYEQYVGIDPGVRSLQISCNDAGRVLETTTPKYRHHCKMKYVCRKRNVSKYNII